MATISVQLKLETERCSNCSIVFALPDYLQKRLRENGSTFYCPNGHGQYYTESDIKKKNDEIARLKGQLSYAQNRAESAKNQATAIKGQMTKLKNRVANGVCPCCKRSFVNLHKHISTKHPDFKENG